MKLSSKWKIKGFDKGCYASEDIFNTQNNDGWYDCKVPGDVHYALLELGIIEDPYYSTNDLKCRWVENKTWWYRNVFEFDEDLAEGEILELRFEGLDTYADIYLNGEQVGSHDNMFIPVTINVTGNVRKGTNILAVKFTPPGEVTSEKPMNDMWYVFSSERQWVRKCAMNFGWDWGPRLVTVGIWKDVHLNVRRYAKLDSVTVKSSNIDIEGRKASINFVVDIEKFYSSPELKLRIKFGDKYNNEIPVTGNNIKTGFELDNAEFWWPFDMGEPYLYPVEVSLISGDSILDTYETLFGVRDIQMRLFTETFKTRFVFVVNGIEIFARGANWIPAHNMLGSIKDERYTGHLEMAKDAGMNMLRVWGGGIYEKDIFYKECDRLGILVWQDFMFACSEYPDFDKEFMGIVEREVISVVKHLRNHACIAIWVGNNENQMQHYEVKLERKMYGVKIYEEMMPKLMKQLDDTRFYWPGSAYGGEDPQNQEIGDKHNWEVWHGLVPSYKNYAKDKTRFCSEFGLHASPVKHTMERNVPPGKLKLGCFELDYRNKDASPDRMTLLLEAHTGLPKDVDQYIDFSMMVQAEGLKYGVEHYRRRFPETAGTIIWQLNDCWPGQSWSMIDYYLYPKASFYYAKKFFAPILVSFKEEDESHISVWVTNNSMKSYNDVLNIGVKSFLGEEIFYKRVSVNTDANKSEPVCTLKTCGWHGPSFIAFQPRWYYVYVKPENAIVASNEYFLKEYKDCRFPECNLEKSFRQVENGLELKIKSDYFARFVKIEYQVDGTHLTDNYFNIYPGETKTVVITHPVLKLEPEMFTVKALNSNIDE